jgi:lipopolysaccharide export system ATP-binding protein
VQAALHLGLVLLAYAAPDSGSVKFKDTEITHKPMHLRARLGIGYLTQEPSVFRKLTVEQNILAILETCKINRTERKLRLKYLLEELDLTPLAQSRAYTLSGGEKRRLEITRALVTSPNLLLLDEPFSGIDAQAFEAIFAVLDALRQRGVTVLLSTHDLEMASTRFDRLVLLNRRVFAEGPAGSVLTAERLAAAYGGRLLVWKDGEPLRVATDDCSP